MAKLTKRLYRLHFGNSPLHLARGKSGFYDQSQRLLHSDTLKSALFASALQLYGEDRVGREFLEAFTVSSAFPFLADEYFFPKPLVRLQQLAGEEPERQGKKLKKIQYLGQRYFEDLLHGPRRQIASGHLVAGGEFVTDHPSVTALDTKEQVVLKAAVQQRLTIPAGYDEDPTPYYVERLHFGPRAGLYFLLDCPDDQVRRQVEGALRLLGDNGLGTDRSVGNGHFTPEAGELTLDCPDGPTHQLSLSLYLPLQQELSEEVLGRSAWGLVKRGGYLASPADPANLSLRKRSVYMFTEGSVFAGKTGLQGKLVDLRPGHEAVQHPVWRDGRAMFVPILTTDL